jgi:hypothetical protein
MKRSGWVTGAAVTQFLLGVLFSGVSLFLLWLVRSPEIKQGEGAAEAIRGIKIAAGIIAPLALLVLAGAYGVWKGKLWGWWLGMLTDLGLVGIFAYSLMDDGWHNIDWDMVAFTLFPLIPTALLLLPGVRRFYWGGGHSQMQQAVIERPPG